MSRPPMARRWVANLAAAGCLALAIATLMPGRWAGAQPVAPIVPKAYETVSLSVSGSRPATISGYLRRPAGDGRVPAIVALHGCGGLFRADGRLSPREADWAERLAAVGYAVLFPDSFNARGYREICSKRTSDRPIRPTHRAMDASAAVAWLASQPFIDASRLALIGWSNGGSSTLWSVARDFAFPGAEIKAAIAFYPGCRVAAETATWAPRVPLTILIGSADNWTAPETCRTIAAKHAVRLIEYPGAVHGFDAPNSPRRTRKGIGQSSTGRPEAEIGTDPKARAAAILEVQEILRAAFAPQKPR